jgi:hypothetical protein
VATEMSCAYPDCASQALRQCRSCHQSYCSAHLAHLSAAYGSDFSAGGALNICEQCQSVWRVRRTQALPVLVLVEAIFMLLGFLAGRYLAGAFGLSTPSDYAWMGLMVGAAAGFILWMRFAGRG